MQNIPMFTTEAGVASLILEQIPYKKEAYIKIHSTVLPEQLLKDCVAFCRSAGAELIYASGHDYLAQFPLHTDIWKMSCLRSRLPKTDAVAIPIQEETLEQWRSIYNERMQNVPNAAVMTVQAAKRMLSEGDGYFVYKNSERIGIGKAKTDTVDVIVSLAPGLGREVLLALCAILSADRVLVEVASANTRAVKLYRSTGFTVEEEISRWYRVETGFACQEKILDKR